MAEEKKDLNQKESSIETEDVSTEKTVGDKTTKIKKPRVEILETKVEGSTSYTKKRYNKVRIEYSGKKTFNIILSVLLAIAVISGCYTTLFFDKRILLVPKAYIFEIIVNISLLVSFLAIIVVLCIKKIQQKSKPIGVIFVVISILLILISVASLTNQYLDYPEQSEAVIFGFVFAPMCFIIGLSLMGIIGSKKVAVIFVWILLVLSGVLGIMSINSSINVENGNQDQFSRSEGYSNFDDFYYDTVINHAPEGEYINKNFNSNFAIGLAVTSLVIVLYLSKAKRVEYSYEKVYAREIFPVRGEEGAQKSYFDGGLLQLWGWKLLGNIITMCTLGICLPWAKVMVTKWEVRHTVIEGKRLDFDGNAVQLFGKWILWWFLSLITIGIYAIWLPILLTKWKTKHTFFKIEEPKEVDGIPGENVSKLDNNADTVAE